VRRLVPLPLMLVCMFACGGDKSPAAPTPPPAPTPAPPAPAPPSTPSSSEIFGVLRESDPSVGVAIPGGTVHITTGPDAGKSTTTDGNGYYVLREVTRGTFTIRSSANGYEPGEQSVSLTNPRQQDLQLRPVLQILDHVLNGTVSGGSTRCGSIVTKPCATFNIPIHHTGTLEATLSWNSGVNDLDLELYRGSTELASSNGVSRNEERITSGVSQGMYQIRVIYYNGSTVQDFQVRVRRPN
jgi:hypothetical protein